MITTQTIQIAGKRLVVMEEGDYERLCRLAGRAAEDSDLPPLPKPDRHGRFPAIEYTRMSIAREIIRERRALGLSQQDLADLAGVRQETLSRIETGKHTVRPATIGKIDRALRRASPRQSRRKT
jgi:DNA-binding XRE family transcriptional regulator